MVEMNIETTLEEKYAFDGLLHSYKVSAKHYHADNGLFDTKVFKKLMSTAKQTLSFCGVNAHHQNGTAENRIKDVATGTRTQLLHVAHRWPSTIDASLWPTVLKNYMMLRNQIPNYYQPGKKEGRKYFDEKYVISPLTKVSGEEKELNVKNIHPFGCPMYVLEIKLQAQQSYNKWIDRARVGIYLCQSPNRSSDMPLVLNTAPVNVSPQFHCIYDDEFSTYKLNSKFKSF